MEEDLQKLSISSPDGGSTAKKLGWFDLPAKARSIIIESMDEHSQFSFTLCSDECADEVGNNRIKTLTVHCNEKDWEVFYFEHYKLKFSNVDGKCEILFTTDVFFRLHPRWKIHEEGDFKNIACKYIRKMLRNAIDLEKFSSSGGDDLLKTISLRHLNNLKSVSTGIIQKIDLFEHGFIDVEQLSLLTECIEIHWPTMTLEQLLQLKAKFIEMHSVSISSSEINQLLQRFVDGQLHQNFKSLTLFSKELDAVEIIKGFKLFCIHRMSYGSLRFELTSTTNQAAVVDLGSNAVTIRRQSSYEERMASDYESSDYGGDYGSDSDDNILLF